MEQTRISPLQLMWSFSYATGISTRKTPHQDGKKNWDLLKESIEMNISFVKDKIKALEKEIQFIKLVNEQTEAIMASKHKDEDGNVIDEKNHFMIQSIRIPNLVDFSIIRLVQIAYNLGQYEGIGEKIDRLPRSKLNEFISDEDIELINSVFLE